MANEDKIMGVRDGTRIHASHRIDIATADDIRFDADGNERFTGAAKSPATDHSNHATKAGYQRKVIVENAATRDEVTSYLNSAGIGHTVEAVSPTASETDAFDQWGAENGTDAVEALKWDLAVSDLAGGLISQADYERGLNPNRSESFSKPRPDKNP